MLDKLPTELVLTIAEFGAPQIAPDRKSLAIVRRRYFASLAAVARALYGALRPYIWEHVQIQGDKADASVGSFTRDPRSAEFVKELVCTDFSQQAFAKLWSLFPRFVKLTSLAISGLLDDTEPLQLCMLERLPVTLGCTRAMSEMKSTRAPVYAVIKHLQRCGVALSFYQHPTCDLVTASTLDELEWLGLEDNEGYFTELLQGRCSDPELRDFKVVMVD